MSWYIYKSNSNAISPIMDQGSSNGGLCKFFLPMGQSVTIHPHQSKRIDSGWIVNTFTNGYAIRTYTGSQTQKMGVIVVPQVFGSNGMALTGLIRNVVQHPITISGGMHIFSTLMDSLAHNVPTIIPTPTQNKKTNAFFLNKK